MPKRRQTRTEHMTDCKRRARRSKATFPFLQLLPELRLHVYDFVILDQIVQPINITASHPRPPALTRVNHLTRAESIPIYLKSEFTCEIIDCDTTKCDALFDLFTSFDTSRVKVNLVWYFEPIGTSRKQFLALMKQAFDGTSKIFPRSDLRPWSTREADWIQNLMRMMLTSMDSTDESIMKGFRQENEDRLTSIAELGGRLVKAREQGMTWEQVEQDLVQPTMKHLARELELLMH